MHRPLFMKNLQLLISSFHLTPESKVPIKKQLASSLYSAAAQFWQRQPLTLVPNLHTTISPKSDLEH